MYVRLGFSVAINVDPGHPPRRRGARGRRRELQRKCMEKFAEFKEQGKTIIVVARARHHAHAVRPARTVEHGIFVDVGEAGTIVDEYMTDVHTDRELDGEHGTRWGTGRGSTDIELLGPDGRHPHGAHR
ncbi:MAG: hypothetical protein U0W40_07710 [Acidimicrobiia bacterium]